MFLDCVQIIIRLNISLRKLLHSGSPEFVPWLSLFRKCCGRWKIFAWPSLWWRPVIADNEMPGTKFWWRSIVSRVVIHVRFLLESVTFECPSPRFLYISVRGHRRLNLDAINQEKICLLNRSGERVWNRIGSGRIVLIHMGCIKQLECPSIYRPGSPVWTRVFI